LGPDLQPVVTEPIEAGSVPPVPGEHAQVMTLDEVERRHIEAVLMRTAGVVAGPEGAAKILDVHPNTLRSRMKKLGVSRGRHEMS
jgi:transcriptional regulator with GAF, ATPase, and Fis domain